MNDRVLTKKYTFDFPWYNFPMTNIDGVILGKNLILEFKRGLFFVTSKQVGVLLDIAKRLKFRLLIVNIRSDEGEHWVKEYDLEGNVSARHKFVTKSAFEEWIQSLPEVEP